MLRFAFLGPDDGSSSDPLDPPMIIAYINGYGAPRAPFADAAYGRYLASILEFLEPGRLYVKRIYLCGGITNNPDLSEAAAMRVWIEAHKPAWLPQIALIEDTTTLQTNLEAFAKRVGYKPNEQLFFFGEESRRWKMWFHVFRLFGFAARTDVLGVSFDVHSLQPKQFWKERLLVFPLEVGATLLPGSIGRLRQHLREEHVRREREKLTRT